ncbi:MAG TPA: hypothetical protein VH352_24725, partial [Pseudonocardiaceae bacterium]|nr:hypothetical protein [Pseudonocardiaceae bacterium]
REVYNVVLRTSVVNTGTATAPSAGFNPTLAALLGGGLNGTSVGANSQLCQDSFTIANFGFAALDGVSSPDTCGAVTNALRAFTAASPL